MLIKFSHYTRYTIFSIGAYQRSWTPIKHMSVLHNGGLIQLTLDSPKQHKEGSI